MTRALLCLALIASPAIASTPTVEVIGYTDAVFADSFDRHADIGE